MSVAFRYAARSDVGLVRANNQDSAYAGPHLLLLADGIGGHAGGDIASSLVVATLAPLDDEALGSGEILGHLEAAIARAHADLVAHARANPQLHGMGTTVTALLRSGNKLAMAHMGDSRAYLVRGDSFTQVTVDHTFVQHLVDSGKITPEEAEHHPQRSVVMRVLGDVDIDQEPDLSMREARPGDRWLLCSDGLSGYVSAETIEATLRQCADPGDCADRLIQLALRAGGPDNVTAIVSDVVDLDHLRDGAAPSTAVEVVGAAAVTRRTPTSASDGPASRAADLAADARARLRAAEKRSRYLNGSDQSADSEDDGVEEVLIGPDNFRRPRPWWILGVIVTLAIVGAAGWGAFRWTQTQYFLGVDDGEVTVYRGLPYTLGPLDLSTPIAGTGLQVDTLPPYMVATLERTIPVADPDDGMRRSRELEREAQSGADATPTPSASARPTLSPTASSVATPTATDGQP